MGVIIPILVLGHGFEELLRGRPQRSGQGDGKLAAIRCYKACTGKLSELPQAQPCDGGSITGEPNDPSSFRENGATAGQKSGIFLWMSVAQVRA